MARQQGVTRSPMLLSKPLEWTQILFEELTYRAEEGASDLRWLDPAQSVTLSLTYLLV
jgi:hypothetical protein